MATVLKMILLPALQELQEQGNTNGLATSLKREKEGEAEDKHKLFS